MLCPWTPFCGNYTGVMCSPFMNIIADICFPEDSNYCELGALTLSCMVYTTSQSSMITVCESYKQDCVLLKPDSAMNQAVIVNIP